MTTLTIPEAVRLCTAWTDRLARDHDVRALVIKGHVLSAQGLREGYESVDVDLLVDPSDYDRFLQILGDHGWSPMTTSTAPTIIAAHAVTVTHPHWPITIDVHHYFPGFLAEPQVVFDALWERHTTARVADVEVRAPDSVGHVALVALHHLRDPGRARSGRELPELTARTRAVLTSEQLAELPVVAAQTGAAETLSPFLEDLGVTTVESTGDPQGLATWRLRTGAPGSVWIVSLLRIPLWRWPAAIWRAIWLTDAEIAAYHRREHETMNKARLRRLGKGLKKLPRALGAFAAHNLRILRGGRQ